MVPDDQQKQSTQEAQVAADLAALSARVESLERQLAELRTQPSVRFQQSAPPPPYLTPNPENPSAPNFAKHLPNSKGSLENRVGSQYFGRIGIVALLIGAFLFLKWAIDNHWIGPRGRIAAGLIAGAAIVLWSERFRRHGFNAFSYSLKRCGQRRALPFVMGRLSALSSAAPQRSSRRNDPGNRVERLHGLVA
jgi:uncharacterized membrane protein